VSTRVDGFIEMFFSVDHTEIIAALLGGAFVLLFITVGVVWVLCKKWKKIPKIPEVLVGVFEYFHFLFLFLHLALCYMHISPKNVVFNPFVEEYPYNKTHTHCKVLGVTT